MAIIKRGENKYLIRVYLGRHTITKKRLEINETFQGSYDDAVKHEQLLKSKAATGELNKSSRMRLTQLVDLYLDSTRYLHGKATQRLLREQFDRYVLPYLGDRIVSTINTHDIQQFLNFLMDPKKRSKDDDRDKKK